VNLKTLSGLTRVVMIRHGEAVVNVEEIIGGHTGCRGLTKEGMRQAELLADRLKKTGELNDEILLYASILPRAIETAEFVSAAFGGIDILKTCELCERHPGVADGLSWEEYRKDYKGNFLAGKNMERPLSPGGETYSEFCHRVKSFLFQVGEHARGKCIVLVSHGGVIEASLVKMLEINPPENSVMFHPKHTSITEFVVTGEHWELQRYNDIAHLLYV
jgi:probable phosphoglycerate mutase